MRALVVVVAYPLIEILLQRPQIMIDLVPEGNLIKLIQDRLVETFANAVGLCGDLALVLVWSMSLIARYSW